MGAQDLAISGTPVLSAWVPEGQVFDLPYLVQTRDQGLALLNGSIGDWWRETLRQRTGVRSLGFLDYGFRQVYNKTRPIKTPDDLKGLKLRVLENPTYIATYRTLGVKATPMAYGEVYTALQQGVIDGGEANAQGYVLDKFLEVAKFFSYTSATYNPITFLINDNLYNGFPPEIRKAIDEAAKESLAFQKDVARKMEDEAVANDEEGGGDHHLPGSRALREDRPPGRLERDDGANSQRQRTRGARGQRSGCLAAQKIENRVNQRGRSPGSPRFFREEPFEILQPDQRRLGLPRNGDPGLCVPDHVCRGFRPGSFPLRAEPAQPLDRGAGPVSLHLDFHDRRGLRGQAAVPFRV